MSRACASCSTLLNKAAPCGVSARLATVCCTVALSRPRWSATAPAISSAIAVLTRLSCNTTPARSPVRPGSKAARCSNHPLIAKLAHTYAMPKIRPARVRRTPLVWLMDWRMSLGCPIVPSVAEMASKDPSFGRMMRRALVLHCPWCGSRRTFIRRWLGKYERCRTCGIRWRREEGFELGAVTINTILTFIVLTAGMTVGFILTAPDIPVVPMILALLGVALVMPILIYPFSYTIWLAFDLGVHRPETPELLEAALAVTDT